uniref:PBS lyase HEAT domain protein repeat-containing protein n=1 Tax=Solibacter usitatus (strain Ellin6076) TaxID=234267 RepID=Q01VL1_SOLUE
MDLKLLQDTPPWDWPPDAAKVFKKTLLDRKADAADRLIAAEMAGNMVAINDDLAGTLLEIAASAGESDELRGKVAISFGPVLEESYTSDFDDPDDLPITEDTYHRIRESLRKLYDDESNPKLVRRRVLEASVRAPEDWHGDAIRAAYASGDQEWMLTAVFAMCYVPGFDELILDALNNPDPDIHFHAVDAAGNWSVDGAWIHVAALVKNSATPKPLIFVAIESLASIRPAEAEDLLLPLVNSPDEEIREVALDALQTAEMEDDDEGEWVN